MCASARAVLVLLVGSTIAFSAPAAATELFVKPAGSGTTCAQSSPCALATALAGTAGGDTIYLAAGSYTGSGAEVALLDKGVELVGGWNGAASGPVVRDPVAYESVLDGEGTRRVVTITGSSVRIDGFTVRNGNAAGTGADCGGGTTAACGGGIFVHASGVTIANNRIVGNIADDAAPGAWRVGWGGGIGAYYADRLTISRNSISGNLASSASAGAGGAILLFNGSDASIVGNLITDNVATTDEWEAGWGGGISLQGGGGGATIERNVFAGNRSAPTLGYSMGNALYTWYFGAELRGNAITCDSLDEDVYLGFFSGAFDGNRVFGGRGSRLVAIINAYGTGVSLANNILVAGGGTQRVVHVDGYVEFPVVANLLHNTIVGNGASVGVYVDEYGTANMRNNIVASNATGLETLDNGAIVADHTLFWSNGGDGIRGTDPIDGDPLFVNAPAGDFRVQAGSAAVGVGVQAFLPCTFPVCPLTTDIDGEARPGVDGIDVGADELAPTAFDFGTPTSPVADGFTQVTHQTLYTSTRGFGWNSGTIASRDRGTGGDLTRDFNFTHTGTFVVDLPNGRYRVTLTMGDATAGHGQMAVFLENVKVATVTTAGNEFKVLPFAVAVTDGQLTVWLNDEGGSDPNVVINALAIEPALPLLADLGTAASPIAPGYERVTQASLYSPAAGIGWLGGIVQSRDRGTADALRRDLAFTPRGMLAAFLANGIYDVTLTLGDATAAHEQMGISVQGAPPAAISTAKNQFVTRSWRAAVADNRLEILLDDLGGSDPNVVVNAIEIARPRIPFFDFGTPTSPVAPGYVQVTHLTRYSEGSGYGWTSGTVQSRDRAVGSDLQRDLCFSPNAEFAVDVVSGSYEVTITLGDAAGRHDLMGVYLEGELVDTVTTAMGVIATSTHTVLVQDGRLDVTLLDRGGTDSNVTIVALEVR